MSDNPLTFTIPPELDGCRLDRALAALATENGLSREQCKRHIQEGRALLNGKVCQSPKAVVREDDILALNAPPQTSELTPEGGELEIIYRDEYILVINKPAGLTVHPCPSCPQGTLVNRLLHHFPDLEGGGERPGIVHRLDKDTSGLLLIARTEKCRLRLAEQFAGREVDKSYAALAHGAPRPPAGEINAPLARSPANKTRMAVQPGGREAITRYETVHAGPRGRFALLDVNILTGRTHQIRVHLAHLGHPLWGDRAYGGKTHLPPCGPENHARAAREAKGPLVAARQMLHARRLAFRHPESGQEMSFSLPLPADFRAALAVLLKEPVRLIITGLPGCGKSALLRALAARGLPTFSADASVDRLYAAGGPGWDLLHRRFNGRFTPIADAPVDRRALAAAMRENDALRREVEHLVHPLVEDELHAFWENNACAPAAAAEIPLYFEAGWHKRDAKILPPAKGSAAAPLPSHACLTPGGRPLPARAAAPIIITVSCPENLRFARLAERGLSTEAARALTAWQWSEADKIKAGQLVLHNNGSLDDLRSTAEKVAVWLAEEHARRTNMAVVECEDSLPA